MAAEPELFRLIADYTYDWETWVDEAGVPRWINAAVQRITGYSVAECLAQPGYPLPLVHEADRALLGSVLEDAARGGSGNDVEFRVVRKDGAERWVAISWQAVRDRAGQAAGFRTSVRDIDERKRMERELALMRRRAEAAVIARSELLANVSHELRSPTHCIAGFAELLLSGPLEPQQRRYVEIIAEQNGGMLRQVEDLLQFAALEAGGLRLEREPLDLCTLVESEVEAALPTAQARGLALRLSKQATCCWVESDGTRLRQVLRNLLDNALKFTEQGSVEVRLAVREERAQLRVLLEVEDSGIGMSAEELERLLAPFQQGDSSSTRRRGGVGLGLSIAQRLVRNLGGTLELSSARGKGTCARVELTLNGAAQQRPSRRALPVARAGGRALVVDDRAAARELLRAMLELSGWEAREAESAAAARAIAARESFDLVLLDYQMPDADGAETALALRQLFAAREPERKVALYLLTANLFVHEQLAELQAIDGVLAKPLGRAELGKLLEEVGGEKSGHGHTHAGETEHEHEHGELDGRVIDDLGEMVGRDGESMLVRVVRQVREDVRRELAALDAALAERDFRALGRAAHTLAGQVALVGARKVAELGRALQSAAEGGELTPELAAQRLAALATAWSGADAALERALSARGPSPVKG